MKKWLIVFISSLSFFLSYFSRIAWSIVSVYSSLKPTVVADGIIFSLFFAGYIIVQIPAGLLSDLFPPRNIGLLSLVGLSISSFLSGVANSIVIEHIASLLMGLSAGWIYPVTIKILSLNFSRSELPIAIGYYSLAWPLSIVIAGLILPYISINLGWRFSYYLIAIISFVTALTYLSFDKKRGEKLKREIVVKDKNVIIVSLAGFMFFLAYWIITLYAYKYFLFIGLNDYIAGFAYSLLALAGIPSTIIAGYIIKKIGVKLTLSSCELFYGLLTILLSFFISSISIMIISTFMGFIRFIITPANSTAVSIIGGKKAGSVTGFANFFWQSSGIIAPLVASFVILSFGYFFLWILSGIIILISSLMYFTLLKI